MPTVGKAKFPYTPAGEQAAAKASKKSGKPLVVTKKTANPYVKKSATAVVKKK